MVGHRTRDRGALARSSALAVALTASLSAGCFVDGGQSSTSTDASESSTVEGATAVGSAGGETTSVTTAETTSAGTSVETSAGTTAAPDNTDPIAGDDAYQTNFEVSLVQDSLEGLLQNDEDPDGDPIVVALPNAGQPDEGQLESASGGLVELEENGAFSYTPAVNFWGCDSFGYTIVDNRGGQGSALVSLRVAPPANSSLARVAQGNGGFALNGAQGNDAAGASLGFVGDMNRDGLDDLLIGAPSGGLSQRDEAYVVFGTAETELIELAEVASGGDPRGFEFYDTTGMALYASLAGYSVSGVGDLNGDGAPEVLVGAPADEWEVGVFQTGIAFLLYGKPDGQPIYSNDLVDDPALGFRLNGELAEDRAGRAVGAVADMNGDGIGELLIGASRPLNPGRERVYVVFGAPESADVLLEEVADDADDRGFEVYNIDGDDQHGDAVAGAPDISGDGVPDLLIGSPDADPDNLDSAGRVYLVHGKPDGQSVDVFDLHLGVGGGLTINGESPGDHAGRSVGVIDDLDGDGLPEILVGAPDNDVGGAQSAGRVYVVFGTGSEQPLELADVAGGQGGFVINGVSANEQAGWSVTSVADFSGDGLPEIVLGAPGASGAGVDSGRVYVVYGKSDTVPVELANVVQGQGGFALDGETAGAFAGYSVAAPGDVNGDGQPDLLIGSYGYAAGGALSGRVYVVHLPAC